jgi:hypothetical protein
VRPSGDKLTLGVVHVRVTVLSAPRNCALAVGAIALVLVASLSSAPSATAASPCATKVLADWYDNGRIDHLYRLDCYQEAIDAIPNDIRAYVDAEEVISRALQDAARGRNGVGPPPTTRKVPTDHTPPPPTAAPPVNTSDASAVPVPLVVLGSLSLLLLSAGAVGYIARRRRGTES